ncbi:MAG: hypothetical protein BWK78_00620, partial [Thiotrichaceae bacterium IS1]
DSKTLLLSRNVGTLNFYVMSNQLETTTSVVIQNEESLAIDLLAQYLWQYRGYSVLGDTLLDALMVLSNWPQGVAFAEPELSTDTPDRGSTYLLTVTISPNTMTGGVTGGTSLGSINCGSGGVCSQQLTPNASVTLTATPAPGYSFNGWSGACTNTTRACTISMTSAKTVTATFTEMPKYRLSVTVSPNTSSGKVTSSFGGLNCGNDSSVCNVNLGGDVKLTAIPSPGYSFKEWSGGVCTGTATTCMVNMNAPKSVTATFFASSYQLSLSTTIEKGAISPFTGNAPVIQSSPAGINCGNNTGNVCNYLFARDSKVTLNITISDSQFVFSAWGGACAGKTQNDCSVNMTAAQTVTATFVLNKLNIYVQPNGSAGTVTTSPSSGISCYSVNSFQQQCQGSNSLGKTVVLKATPSAGYKFTGWSGACTGTTNSCTVTMNGPKAVYANFAQQ